MKAQYTTIVGVNSTASDVEILYYPAGADTADKPFQMFVTPHQNNINVHFGNIGEKVVKPDQTCANGVTILLNDE